MINYILTCKSSDIVFEITKNQEEKNFTKASLPVLHHK